MGITTVLKKKFTFLKRHESLVRAYHKIICIYNRYIIGFKLKNLYLNKSISLFEISSSRNSESFFGYYNNSPFNKNLIVYCETKNSNYKYPCSIILYNHDNGEYKKIAESYAWNWQQGCMLQWYNNSNDLIIYNDFSLNAQKYISVIHNIYTGEKKELPLPINSVSKSGKFALTLNYERLALIKPDYGYFNRNVLLNDLPNDNEDGIWYIDIKNNSTKLLLSLDKIKSFLPDETMLDALHKVNHIDISPGEDRFMFLHRWVSKRGRFMRLLTANTKDGSDLFLLTGNDMVSHNCWFDDYHIISFCRFDGKDRYVMFKDLVGYQKIIGDKDFDKDGHPSVSLNKEWLLTDEYPRKDRFSGLYLYNFKKKEKIVLGRFFQSINYNGPKRVDLHPRWSYDNDFISIDSAHTGKRKLYIMDISKILNKK